MLQSFSAMVPSGIKRERGDSGNALAGAGERRGGDGRERLRWSVDHVNDGAPMTTARNQRMLSVLIDDGIAVNL